MKQFNLSEWLKDKSRKLCTRNGRPVRIICTDRKARSGNIVGLVGEDESLIYVWNNDGKHIVSEIPDNDLFFADEEEELTEIQKTLEEDCDCYVNLYNDGKTRKELREWIKCWCHSIIDLARKELFKEQENCVVVPENDYYEQLSVQYQKGKQDALKDLPKWKKATEDKEFDRRVLLLEDDKVVIATCVFKDEYYIELNDLRTLPKEE